MKYRSAKSILSERTNFKLDEEQLQTLHNVLFFMLKDLKASCERHGLKYMLSGGTCLGAVRHKGFIPWDDDIDIMMPRNDCEKLEKAMLEDYGDRYSFTDINGYHIFRLLLNGTVYEELKNDDPSRQLNIYIDIFPIDNMPKGKRRFRAWRFYWAKHAIAFILEYKYPSKIIKEVESEDEYLRSYYRKRRLMGRFFNLFGSVNHYNKIVHKLANYKKQTGYLGIPMAVAYNREKFSAEVLTETQDAEFCGETFKIPVHYDEYLTNLYGSDYMTPPPPEKREVHPPAKIDFGKYEKLNERGEFDD